MVQAVAEKEVSLAWDAYVEPNARVHVEGFRKANWAKIRSDLNKDYGIVIEEGIEPLWTTSGKAILWQEQFLRQRVVVVDDDGSAVLNSRGRVMHEIREASLGWEPTSPQPANNASQISNYWKRGIRLRPPVNGVEPELMQSLPVQEEAEPEEPERLFYCDCKSHRRNEVAFKTWKGYVQHCLMKGEPVREEPPPEVAVRMSNSVYFCVPCDKSFETKRAAALHVRGAARRPKRYEHPTVEGMEVRK